MVIFVVTKASASLRGRLTRWLFQLKPGVYVGTLSTRVRTKLWKRTCESIRGGWAVMLFPARNEQGFDLLTHGIGPVEFEDIEGLWVTKRG